jgi:hypothetical protein
MPVRLEYSLYLITLYHRDHICRFIDQAPVENKPEEKHSIAV